MVFLHEMYHTSLGGGYQHAEYLEQDMVLRNTNTIRKELNNQGWNFGQRMSYKSTVINGRAYLPFSRTAANCLKDNLRPASYDKFISTKHNNFMF